MTMKNVSYLKLIVSLKDMQTCFMACSDQSLYQSMVVQLMMAG